MRPTLSLFSVLVLFSACQPEKPLFERLPSSQTGITFNNHITESDSINSVDFEYVYNGGGVGVGDFNNDGLTDVFFSGNQVPSKLYLNKSDLEGSSLQFEDITQKSNIQTPHWNTGVSVVDINQDGLLDIYLCTVHPKRDQSAPNQLFLNQGIDKNGVPHFKDVAAEVGLADRGYSTQAAFFDYDLDGDLDLYLLTNALETFNRSLPLGQRKDGSGRSTDRLYRNDNFVFSNVSKAAGIQVEGWGLGIAIADLNNDGWPDVYCGNDFQSNDLMWINNQDGTFSNRIAESLRHQTSNSMGCDIADLNNDGQPEIVNLDMMPDDNLRQKTMFSKPNYDFFRMALDRNYQPQYVRNSLQLHQGYDKKTGLPIFSEIGQFAGVYATDWSWAPLLADFDNDGYRDLLITNGYRKDITNLDFVSYSSKQSDDYFSANSETPQQRKTRLKQMEDLLGVKKSNYMFRNNGNTDSPTFEDVTKKWGLQIPSFSNGAAYADFDNDGDLDIVVNNIDDEAFVYLNRLEVKKAERQKGEKEEGEKAEREKGNGFLRVNLVGEKPNLAGFGAKVTLYSNNEKQYAEQSPYRGYKSSVETILHFGLGATTRLDSVVVKWLGGKQQTLKNVAANQVLKVYQKQAASVKNKPIIASSAFLAEVSGQYNLNYEHQENDFADFKTASLLPHKHSQAGPALAVGDLNGDRLDDVLIGGSSRKSATIFWQQTNGSFQKSFLEDTLKPKISEDMGLLIFDADADGDNDLYCVSGSSEFGINVQHYQNRFYRNLGKGKFQLEPTALPKIESSGSCVVGNDFDKDGDLDLFVGGRISPMSYPVAPRSYLLQNDGKGHFQDITAQIAPDLVRVGMVTSALWTDYDNDGWADLAIVGEFMPITFFKNTNGKRLAANISSPKTDNQSLMAQVGWFNSLVAGDFDNDGDTDYVAGNLGLNSIFRASGQEPVCLYAKDYDQNGTIDPILCRYVQGKEYISHYRESLTDQLVTMKKALTSYEKYGKSTFKALFSDDMLRGATILRATQMASVYVQNNGNGNFELISLPTAAQMAPIFGMMATDVNQDGELDLLTVGNDYSPDTHTGRYDASIGNCLLGNGKGNFRAATYAESGFLVRDDAKALAEIALANGRSLTLATQNRGQLKVFENRKDSRLPFQCLPTDSYAVITIPNGKKRKQEFYFGSTYLSQSSRTLIVPDKAILIEIVSNNGKRRVVK